MISNETSFYLCLVDLARFFPPFLAIAVDGATTFHGEVIQVLEHDPLPGLVFVVRRIGRSSDLSEDLPRRKQIS